MGTFCHIIIRYQVLTGHKTFPWRGVDYGEANGQVHRAAHGAPQMADRIVTLQMLIRSPLAATSGNNPVYRMRHAHIYTRWRHNVGMGMFRSHPETNPVLLHLYRFM